MLVSVGIKVLITWDLKEKNIKLKRQNVGNEKGKKVKLTWLV